VWWNNLELLRFTNFGYYVETLGSQLGDHEIFSFTLLVFACCGVFDHQYLYMFITCMISTKLDKCLIRTFAELKFSLQYKTETKLRFSFSTHNKLYVLPASVYYNNNYYLYSIRKCNTSISKWIQLSKLNVHTYNGHFTRYSHLILVKFQGVNNHDHRSPIITTLYCRPNQKAVKPTARTIL